MSSFIGIIKRGHGIIKGEYALYNSLPILIYILPYIILYLMLFSPSASSSQNMVNLGLVGHWINNYGGYRSIKVLKGEELPYDEKGIDYAFCATEKGMAIFGIYEDGNDQPKGSLKAFLPVRGCIDIEIKTDLSGTYGKAVYAYLAAKDKGIHIINITDLEMPQYIAGRDTPGSAYELTVSGDYALMADGNTGLQIIDISDKTHPMITGGCDTHTHGSAHGVTVSGDYAFVAYGDTGLQIIDISDKTHPEIAGGCDTPSSAQGVAVSGDYAFVADGYNGLLQFKINFGPSTKGNLILLNGGGINQIEEYWHLSREISNGIFNTFIGNGYEVYDICYLTSGPQDVDNDGVPDPMAVDGLHEKTELESVIKKLPEGHLSGRKQD